MAARRRSHVPPYEIMGRHTAGPSGRPADPVEPAYAEPESAGEPSPGPWWVGSSTPIILRVPRGLALVALAAAVGLLIIAYLAGYSIGDSSGAARVRGKLTGQSTAINHQPPAVPSQTTINSIGYNGATVGASSAGTSTSGIAVSPATPKRKKGLNYLILATYPKDWAVRLQTFLAGKGAKTVLDQVGHGDKYHVVAVGQGFSASQLHSRQESEYEDHMHQLGRAWQAYNHGQGDKLESMYFDKYGGP